MALLGKRDVALAPASLADAPTTYGRQASDFPARLDLLLLASVLRIDSHEQPMHDGPKCRAALGQPAAKFRNGRTSRQLHAKAVRTRQLACQGE